jgi:hypothetical protein
MIGHLQMLTISFLLTIFFQKLDSYILVVKFGVGNSVCKVNASLNRIHHQKLCAMQFYVQCLEKEMFHL